MANLDFIHALPKAELHLHLEGAIEPATLLELARRHPEPFRPDHSRYAEPTTLDLTDSAVVDRLYHYEDFVGFLMAFKAVTEQLRTPEDYELITYELMRRLKAENVLHAEVYISVGVIHWRGQEFASIFEGLERGRARGAREFGVSLLWIFDAVRHFGPDAAQRVFEEAVQYRDRNVIGIGIGGDEQRAGAQLFHESYAFAKQNGLHLTAHAGESAGPESIWAALNIGAERVGHALTAWQDRELMAVLVERQVPLELCPTSNLRTGCCRGLEQHPLKTYFDLGAMVTLNSDDPAMFRTSLLGEYQLAQDHFGFTDEQLRELARNSFEASFLPADQKLAFLKQIDCLA
jgi:aminodeoxyfutalosine deaminase